MSSAVKTEYAASSAVTITLASLATDANVLTGVESGEIDNTTNKYPDYQISGFISTGTSPTTAKQLEVYVVGKLDDSNWPDVFDGTGSAETITSLDIKNAICRLVALVGTDATSNRNYPFGPVSVRRAFGGIMPKKFVVFVTHNTGVNLNATAGNHAVNITPEYPNIG